MKKIINAQFFIVAMLCSVFTIITCILSLCGEKFYFYNFFLYLFYGKEELVIPLIATMLGVTVLCTILLIVFFAIRHNVQYAFNTPIICISLALLCLTCVQTFIKNDNVVENYFANGFFLKLEKQDNDTYLVKSIKGKNNTVDFNKLFSSEIKIAGFYPHTLNVLKDEVKTIVLPNYMTEIPTEFFKDFTNLTTVVLPSTIEKIGVDAFKGCDNLEYKIDKNCKYLGNEDNPYFACIGPQNLVIKEATISDKTKLIADDAFKNCNQLAEITVPFIGINKKSFDTFGSIFGSTSYYQYNNCVPQSLTKVTINSNIEEIKDFAFANCNNIHEINIPSSVNKIGMQSFDSCFSLQDIDLSHVNNISDRAFYNCDKLANISFSTDLSSIGCFAFAECDSLNNISLTNKLKTIENNAFYHCKQLSEITIPESVTKIGNYAFYNCDSLEKVFINSQNTSLGEYAFSECNLLNTVEINGSVDKIGDYAFCNCVSLLNLKLSDDIKTIGKFSFSNCKKIENLILPKNLICIDENAFSYCFNLRNKNVIIPQNVLEVKEDVFKGINYLTVYCYYNSLPEKWSASFIDLESKVVYGYRDF